MTLKHYILIFNIVFALTFCVLLGTDVAPKLLWLAFGLSPFVVLLTVYLVICKLPYNGRELKKGEEYGYGDRSTDTLKAF